MADKKLEINGTVYEDEDDILWNKNEFKEVVGKTLEDEHRWYNLFSMIMEHIATGRFFKIYFYRNASESQDGQELDSYSWAEVFPTEKTITVYLEKPAEVAA